MLQALQRFDDQYAFKVDVIDVDLDETLVEQYDELVPVLVANKVDGEKVELCHYFLDEAKVRAFLGASDC
jgi:hypothetical protein